MKNIKSTILVAFLLITTAYLYAVPAIPNPVQFTQPNGEILTIMIKGDERIHWSESIDGYTLLYNQDGYLTYAILDEDGNLQPSDVIATDIEERDFAVRTFLNTIDKKLFYSDVQKQLMLKVWEIEDTFENRGERGLEGQYKTLCAFVQFPNKSMTKSISQFEGLFNQLGYTVNGKGSVRDYFKESSYNKFDLIITLCGIYTAPQNESYYAGNDGTQNCQALARWAALQVAAEPDINFADYDSNNDGKVDGFHFIFAGIGQESSGNKNDIWSHSWEFYPSVNKNGKSISVYSCSPELLYGSTITTIGVICHEMTHAFGAPDFYDTNYGSGGLYDGTGMWDIMAEGSWNGYPSGNCPPHHNMYTKIQFGWVTPVVLNSPTTITDMPNSTENPVAFRINTGNGNEHYLLDNRQRIKFDASVPGNGLLVYHVHSSVGSYCINCTHPQKMYPVCASSNVAIPTAGASNYGNINSGGCPFPGSSGKTSFGGTSTPRMFHWTNTVIEDKPITNIAHSSGKISFDFMGGGSLMCFVTLTANPTSGGTTTGAGGYLENSSVTVKATPNTNYSFFNWTKSGIIVETNPSYTFTIEENTELVANFRSSNANLSELTVTPGTLDPTFNTAITNYSVNVPHSVSSITIKCVAEDAKATISGDGDKSLAVGNNDFTITVTAEDGSAMKEYFVNVIRAGNNQYTIVSSVENSIGGIITPEGETIVEEGDFVTYSISPNDNYIISDVLVNNVSQGGINTYTFENVQSNGTIHVIFIKDVRIDDKETANIKIFGHQNCIYIKNESNVEIKAVEIVDMLGRSVYHEVVSNKPETLIALQVESGIYYVIIYGNDETQRIVTKVLITK
jgi:M6 family metalloprotease-like protein